MRKYNTEYKLIASVIIMSAAMLAQGVCVYADEPVTVLQDIDEKTTEELSSLQNCQAPFETEADTILSDGEEDAAESFLEKSYDGKGYIFEDSNGTLTCRPGFPAKCPDSINPSQIKSVIIQKGVNTIDDRGFYRCENLASVSIADSVNYIGKSAFAKCTAIKSVTIPGSVSTIGDSAFFGCKGLSKVSISNGVTTIGDCAFSQCEDLQSVNIPGSVKSVGFMTFYDCLKLSSLSIASGVETIGRSAFNSCTSLVSVSLPDTVSTIEESAFYGCASLTAINLPYGIAHIPTWAFYECERLKSISMPDSVVKIGSRSFYGCNSLGEIQGGAFVKEVGSQAFLNTGNSPLATALHQGAGQGLKGYDWASDNRTVSYKNMPNNTKAKGPKKEPVDPTDKFADVFSNKWYAEAIRYVTKKGIMSGTGERRFEPDAPCTRAMFVQIVYNMENKPAYGTNPFYDVEPGKWYANAIAWAYASGITNGKAPGIFGPNENVTRETVAQFLMNYAKKKGLDTLSRADINSFPDNADISSWAAASLSWANAYGIVKGYSNGNVAPRDICTRAQIAQMIMNFQNAFGL